MIGMIQIQTIDRCNLSCIMCPRKWIYQTGKVLALDELRFILDQIIDAQKEKLIVDEPRIILGFLDEPLLDKDFCKKVKLVKEVLPKCRLSFYTNGTLVAKRLDELLEIGKLFREIVYSNYGDDIEPWRETSGLNISEKEFENMKTAINTLKETAKVRFWNAWRNGKLFNFSTRAGLVKEVNIKQSVKGCDWGMPHNNFHIHSNGDAVLCCQDWKHETKFANVFADNIINILNSEAYLDMMNKATGKKASDLLFICKRCKFNKG